MACEREEPGVQSRADYSCLLTAGGTSRVLHASSWHQQQINAENLTLEGKLKELGLFCLKKERTRRQQVKYISKCKVFMQG